MPPSQSLTDTAGPRITAVTCVKDEGPYLIEWIAFHRLAGVRNFLFYSNGCTDGTDALLDALAHAGVVEHRPNPAKGRAYQIEALAHARHLPIVTEADWIWIADVDEFVGFRAPGGFAGLIARTPDAKAISLSYYLMAAGDVTEIDARPVTDVFRHSHGPDLFNDSPVIEVKTLIHRDVMVDYFGAHRPFLKADQPLPLWVDGSGQRVTDAFARAIRGPDSRVLIPARNHASLYHYALRARAAYLLKQARGDVNRENRSFGVAYWRARNDGRFTPPPVAEHLPGLAAEMARLRALPGVAALETAARAAHQTGAQRLLATAEGRELFDLLGATPQICETEAIIKVLMKHD